MPTRRRLSIVEQTGILGCGSAGMSSSVSVVMKLMRLSKFAYHRAGCGVATEQLRQVALAFLIKEEVEKAQLRPIEQLARHDRRGESPGDGLGLRDASSVTLLLPDLPRYMRVQIPADFSGCRRNGLKGRNLCFHGSRVALLTQFMTAHLEPGLSRNPAALNQRLRIEAK